MTVIIRSKANEIYFIITEMNDVITAETDPGLVICDHFWVYVKTFPFAVRKKNMILESTKMDLLTIANITLGFYEMCGKKKVKLLSEDPITRYIYNKIVRPDYFPQK